MIEKEWLAKNRFYYQVDETKLQNIFYFSLVWNIYEKEICDKDGRIGIHPNEHSQKYSDKVDKKVLNSVFDYFKNRYVSNGQPAEHFKTFEFKSKRIKDDVFDCLTKDSPSSEQKVKTLLCIAFRLRNNLFHGQKQVDKLYEQNENFRQINLLLINLIDSK